MDAQTAVDGLTILAVISVLVAREWMALSPGASGATRLLTGIGALLLVAFGGVVVRRLLF